MRNPVRMGRDLKTLLFACLLTGSLTGCGDIGGLGSFASSDSDKPAESAAPGSTIGSGPVKVGLILPLTGAEGSGAAVSLRNAAELALSEFQSQDITILVKDDRGTPAGAQAATGAALAEGAEIILGPMYSSSVQSAAPLVKAAGKQMIAFSSDESVAAPDVFLLSFLPQSDVERIVGFAAEKGKKSFAVLAPLSTYGNVTTVDFQQAVARVGGQVVAVERYEPGSVSNAAQRLKASMTGADALFIPEEAANLATVIQALKAAKLPNVQLLGTGIWNQPSTYAIAGLQGAWFSAAESEGFRGFSARYKAKFGSEPARLATLGFDAAALVAALTKTQGARRFAPAVLTNSSGFAGQDGIFRFRSNGTNDRALAVYQISKGRAGIISPAPKSFKSSGF